MEHYLQTDCGAIQGTTGTDPAVSAYLGIRYAQAGRWEYPTLTGAWQGIYDATHYGPCCIQQRTYQPEEQSGRVFYYHEFREGVHYTYSEDCQNLNIWAADGAKEAPVLVYLHGGAFLGGSAQEKCFDGSKLAKRGLVVVTVNFRLGALGYGAFPELELRVGHAGNYGIYDAFAALQWVQAHIAAFGGNPANVTLMGQSAGARMVQLLCLSPMVKGLVHRAVLCSGGGQVNLFGRQKTVAEVYPLWQHVREASGAGSFAELEVMPTQDLLAAFGRCIGRDFAAMQAACCPVADGLLLPLSIEEAVAQKQWLDFPYMIGSTSEDLTARDLCSAAQGWLASEKQACYRYHFSRKLPGDTSGAFHSADLWYWFGTLDNSWRPFSEWDRTLSEMMMDYLAAFAAGGAPYAPGLPDWTETHWPNQAEMLHLSGSSVHMEQIDPTQFPQEDGWQ